jgi:hypothetical protein
MSIVTHLKVNVDADGNLNKSPSKEKTSSSVKTNGATTTSTNNTIIRRVMKLS